MWRVAEWKKDFVENERKDLSKLSKVDDSGARRGVRGRMKWRFREEKQK